MKQTEFPIGTRALVKDKFCSEMSFNEVTCLEWSPSGLRVKILSDSGGCSYWYCKQVTEDLEIVEILKPHEILTAKINKELEEK